MIYSENELQQIEKYAAIYLKISDMVVMMLAQVGSQLTIENAHHNLLDIEDDE